MNILKNRKFFQSFSLKCNWSFEFNIISVFSLKYFEKNDAGMKICS